MQTSQLKTHCICAAAQRCRRSTPECWHCEAPGERHAALPAAVRLAEIAPLRVKRLHAAWVVLVATMVVVIMIPHGHHVWHCVGKLADGAHERFPHVAFAIGVGYVADVQNEAGAVVLHFVTHTLRNEARPAKQHWSVGGVPAQSTRCAEKQAAHAKRCEAAQVALVMLCTRCHACSARLHTSMRCTVGIAAARHAARLVRSLKRRGAPWRRDFTSVGDTHVTKHDEREVIVLARCQRSAECAAGAGGLWAVIVGVAWAQAMQHNRVVPGCVPVTIRGGLGAHVLWLHQEKSCLELAS